MEISCESRLEMKDTSSQQNIPPQPTIRPERIPPLLCNPLSYYKAAEEIPQISTKEPMEEQKHKLSSNESREDRKSPATGRWSKAEDDLFMEGIIRLMCRTYSTWKGLD